VIETSIPAAGDPFGAARRFTEEKCREAIAEDAARLGRPRRRPDVALAGG
jgi:hypothetical protein